MENKKDFGKYITEKRKNANLTQEELATKLYVLPSTISKWERGVSYPDITVITNLCKELNISEHEFFTACDDESLNREKKEIQRYRNIKKVIFYLINIGYLIGIITSFICNLVLDHKLTWSLIVLIGVGISFTITSLPVYLKKNKYILLKITLLVNLLVYLLLFTITYIYKFDWLIKSIIIASFVFIFIWIGLLIITFTKIDKMYKISINLIIISLVTIFTNPLSEYVLNINRKDGNLYNIISAIIIFFIALILSIKTIIKNKVKLKD